MWLLAWALPNFTVFLKLGRRPVREYTALEHVRFSAAASFQNMHGAAQVWGGRHDDDHSWGDSYSVVYTESRLGLAYGQVSGDETSGPYLVTKAHFQSAALGVCVGDRVDSVNGTPLQARTGVEGVLALFHAGQRPLVVGFRRYLPASGKAAVEGKDGGTPQDALPMPMAPPQWMLQLAAMAQTRKRHESAAARKLVVTAPPGALGLLLRYTRDEVPHLRVAGFKFKEGGGQRSPLHGRVPIGAWLLAIGGRDVRSAADLQCLATALVEGAHRERELVFGVPEAEQGGEQEPEPVPAAEEAASLGAALPISWPGPTLAAVAALEARVEAQSTDISELEAMMLRSCGGVPGFRACEPLAPPPWLIDEFSCTRQAAAAAAVSTDIKKRRGEPLQVPQAAIQRRPPVTATAAQLRARGQLGEHTTHVPQIIRLPPLPLHAGVAG